MTRVIGSTDVYSRKHIDRQHDRLDRLRVHDKERIRAIEARLRALEALLSRWRVSEKLIDEE